MSASRSAPEAPVPEDMESSETVCMGSGRRSDSLENAEPGSGVVESVPGL